MNNTITKNTDGINLYYTFQVKSALIGKIITSILIFILLFVFALVFITTNKEEIGQLILPMIVMISLLIFFPIRYLIWNICGKETLIVNSKTISFKYDYGILKTNLKTIHYERLGLEFEIVKEYDDVQKGNLTFYNYREIDDLPEIIHKTSVIINLNTLLEIKEEISLLLNEQSDEKFSLNDFSLN